MRAMVIVIVTPGRDQLSGVTQVGEQVLVEALVPEVDLPGFSGERLSHFESLALECDRAFEAAR